MFNYLFYAAYPDGDPSDDFGPNKYRSAELTITAYGTLLPNELTTGYGTFGEEVARGDSGGPCLLVDPTSGPTTHVVALIDNSDYAPISGAKFLFLGNGLYSLADNMVAIERTIASARPRKPVPLPTRREVNINANGDVVVLRQLPTDLKPPVRPPLREEAK